MWPFRQAKPLNELGSDIPSVLTELKVRKRWKRLPPELIQRFGDNTSYNFDRPGEAADALMRLVMMLEYDFLPGKIEVIAAASNWQYELDMLSIDLQEIASFQSQAAYSARTSEVQGGALAVLDSAATAQLVCERYDLWAYTTLARISVDFGQNKEEALVWCSRYARAEASLLAAEDSALTSHARAMKDSLDVEKTHGIVESLRKHVSREVAGKHLPNCNPSEYVTPRKVIEHVEELIGVR